MSLLRVDLRKKLDHSYDVEVVSGAREIFLEEAAEIRENKKFAVVCDSRVARLYGRDLVSDLRERKVECEIFSFPAGERSKSLEVAAMLARKMLKKRFSRSDMVVALGGGVTGDLAGFVASVFMRGIRFVQVPTTLLAMTDASIGGKTGVNLPEGKNLLGTFYQPDKVYVDVQFLKTLSKKNMKNGYAEIVKHAVIDDKKLFKLIESASQKDLFENFDFINKVLLRSCAVKTKIVSRDEIENSLRMKLNLGHTLGHAIEKELNFGIDHGEAVSIGLSKICDVAVASRMLSEKNSMRIKNVLKQIGLPLEISKKLNKGKLVRAMGGDKKVREKKLYFVVPVSIGKVVLDSSISDRDFLKVL